MINRYPLWRYVLLVAVVVVGFIYGLPNLYGEDPAIQVSHRTRAVTEIDLALVTDRLMADEISYKSAEIVNDRILVRFADTQSRTAEDAQLAAADAVRDVLSSEYIVALNLAPSTPEWLQALGALPMYLGLDLRGGVHFLLEVDMEAAIGQAEERYVEELRGFMREEKIRYVAISREESGVKIRFTKPEERDKALEVLADEYRDLVFEPSTDERAYFVDAHLSQSASEAERKSALEQNITTLRNRVNELGVAEPVIQQQGENRVVVQLPGVQDTARAKEILGATATLEFRLTYGSLTDWRTAAETGRVPVQARLYRERNGEPVLLSRRVIITGDQIVGAAAGIDQQTASPDVTITLDGRGASRMSKVTRDNIGKPMAVVFIETKVDTKEVDGETVRTKRQVEEVINVATIRDQLSKRFHITGLDSTREARDLALLLRAGALRAPMEIVEERTVGPSLGRENIKQGFNSVVIGFVAVLIFMGAYYRIFGLVADLALSLNLVLIVALLSMLQATLTMPGIAGIVLTVGMAVDANVLIFERIREELRNGNTPQAAIHVGYERAFGTIADANITTLIAAIVLFGFGTGPIKGFAVTLSIGIVTSMFTAIFGTRAVINLIYGGRTVRRLAI
jgi:preprotein translocase subunit SecD